jgi:3-hydroxyacyl-[acyl-carrier-protein] dehydratase
MPSNDLPQDLPVLDFLKQRFPILMVDKVLSCEKGKRIHTLKAITVNEVHFKGHFPGVPIFPGVLTIECFAQTAAILIRLEDGEQEGMFDVIGSVMEFRFLKPLLPGDRLEVRMEITKAVGTNRIIEGRGTVEGETVATGKFTFGKLRFP